MSSSFISRPISFLRNNPEATAFPYSSQHSHFLCFVSDINIFGQR
ncbi:unnamed protein product [Schistosoma mattheei]|uniref:Uncharacterized protein n=1 Tax=Schistosoma mattheei TaxID=31246 RepID=A0A3P7XA22_9TREM|nr:unnamed protein product [Schistosoma mattheei]